MVPLSALLFALVQWRKKRYFGEHLVLALHFIAFWLLAIFIVMYGSGSVILRLLAHRGIHFPDTKVDAFLFPITRLVQAIYLYFAFRAFYRDSVLAALLKSALVALPGRLPRATLPPHSVLHGALHLIAAEVGAPSFRFPVDFLDTAPKMVQTF
jgi:hypothetical protein